MYIYIYNLWFIGEVLDGLSAEYNKPPPFNTLQVANPKPRACQQCRPSSLMRKVLDMAKVRTSYSPQEGTIARAI